MTSPQERYQELNTQTKGPQIIPGLREKILCSISLFLQLMDLIIKEDDDRETWKDEKDHSKGKEKNAFNREPFRYSYGHITYYDRLLNAGIYCLGLVKSKVKNFEDMVNFRLPHYYDGINVAHTPIEVNQAFWEVFRSLENPLKENHFKHNKTPVQIIDNIKTHEIPSKTFAWTLIYSFSFYGIYINAGHQMASVNQILTLMSLFSLRFKECWYQDAGVNLQKNISKKDRSEEEKFRRFNNYGLNRTFYHHFRMLNYPKETKARLRRMTGVGTDIIDYINVCRKRNDPFNEKNQIKGAIKRKLAFWNHNTNVDDYLSFLEENVQNEAALSSINAIFLGLINMRMPAVGYNIVLPAIFWFKLPTHKIMADFSSQSAYYGYTWLRTYMKKGFYFYYDNDPKELAYATIMSIFDLHQADQNLVELMFDDMKPMTRADFSPTLKKGNKAVHFELPELEYWSKMYNGERGGGGEEQSSVVQVHAGTTSYKGDDFIITKPTEVSYIEQQTGGIRIQQRLQEELRQQYMKKHNKVATYGTQKWFKVVDVTRDNAELENIEGVEFSISKIQPFYTSVKGITNALRVLDYQGRTSKKRRREEDDDTYSMDFD